MTDTATVRPYVIVHMTSSIDGRIQTRRWSKFGGASGLYEQVHTALAGDAWMCGRITMQGYTRGTAADDADPTPVPRTDHVARGDAASYAVALDAHEHLHWGIRNEIEGDHVVVVLTESVSDQHLNALRASDVSYLFAGKDTVDFALLLTKLGGLFGIKRLLVEGGGLINGSFLAAGLVDEISLLLAPAVDGGRGIPAVFDYDTPDGTPPGQNCRLTLTECEPLPNGVVRLRYAVAQAAEVSVG